MANTYSKPEWRFKQILLELGTAEEVCWLLFGKGFEPPPEDTVQGWRNRNSIPGCWVPVIMELAFEKGLIETIDDLKPREKKNDRSSIRYHHTEPDGKTPLP